MNWVKVLINVVAGWDRSAIILFVFFFGLVQNSSCQETGKEPALFPLPGESGGEIDSPLKLSPLPVSASETFPPLTGSFYSGSDDILPVSGCASCGSGTIGGGFGRLSRGAGASRYDSVGCGGPDCSVGRTTCYACEHDGFFARLLCGVYEAVACPDPCYEPGWAPLMDVGFFTECVRPVSQQRIQFTSYRHMTNYDRNSYKIAAFPLGPISQINYTISPYLTMNEASLYTEIAAGNVGLTFEVPYVGTTVDQGYGGAGFGNMTVGTKTTMVDTELLQLGSAIKTNLPVGLSLKGLGNGLVSMEMMGLFGLKISETCYLQGNLSGWVPFGGVVPFPGTMFITRFSLNKQVWEANPVIPLFLNLEYSAYYFTSGNYTPYQLGTPGPQNAMASSGQSYQQLGPGIRLFMTDKLDVGFGTQFSLNPSMGSWGDQQYRVDFRFRY